MWRSPVVFLDTSAHLGYWQLHGDGFTDGTGAIWGAEKDHAGVVGVAAKIYSPYLIRNYLFLPYVRGGIDFTFDRSQTTAIPAQAGFAADQLVINGIPRNIEWVEAGAEWLGRGGITLKLSANYSVSNLSNGYGGRVALKVRF
jgi:hypothetical protein